MERVVIFGAADRSSTKSTSPKEAEQQRARGRKKSTGKKKFPRKSFLFFFFQKEKELKKNIILRREKKTLSEKKQISKDSTRKNSKKKRFSEKILWKEIFDIQFPKMETSSEKVFKNFLFLFWEKLTNDNGNGRSARKGNNFKNCQKRKLIFWGKFLFWPNFCSTYVFFLFWKTVILGKRSKLKRNSKQKLSKVMTSDDVTFTKQYETA